MNSPKGFNMNNPGYNPGNDKMEALTPKGLNIPD
jgi:hypothetical protein